MIIQLDFEIDDLNVIPKYDCVNLFTKIAECNLEGVHLFLISKRITKWVLDNYSLFLSAIHEEQLKLIGDDFAELYGIKEVSNTFLIVKPKGELEKSENEKFWSIGYNELIESGYLGKPVLVVENIKYDGILYELIFKYTGEKISKKYKFKQDIIEFKFPLAHGGGNSTADLLDYILRKENKITVCICDTDLIAPDGKTSGTYNGAKKILYPKCKKLSVHKRNSKFLGILEGTPGRELENFLSLEIIFKTIKYNRKYNKHKLINTEIFRKYKNIRKLKKIRNSQDIK